MVMKNSRPVRIDPELENIIKQVATKNKIKMREASKELAKMCKFNLKGRKISKDILF